MPDLFEEAVSAEDFALPGDAERLGRMAAKAEAAAEPQTEYVEAPAAAEPAEAEPVADAPAEGTPPSDETPAVDPAVVQLEKRLQDKDEFIGRLSNELGELRQAVTQMDQRVNAPAPVEVTTDLIDTNPALAAQLAYDQNNGVAFQAAFEAWKDFDPTTAAVWAAGKQADEREAELKRTYEERFARMEASLGPVSQQTAANEAGRLISDRAAAIPGLGEFITNTPAVTAMANEFPDEAEHILNGTPDQKVRAFEKLFLIHRGRESDTHRATQEEVARETAVAAQQAREDAFVASATTTSSGVKPSRAEQIGSEWDAMDAPYKDGWNV